MAHGLAHHPAMRAHPAPLTALALLAAWTVAATLWFVSPWFPMQSLATLESATGGWVSVTLVASCAIGLVQVAILLGPGRQHLRGLGLRASRLPAAFAVGCVLWALMHAGTLATHHASGSQPLPHPAWLQGAGFALGPLLAQLLGTALMEETVFRGFLWPQFARRLGGGSRGALLGALASQALFALMHIPILAYQGADAGAMAGTLLMLFVVGLVFVLVYASTGNLWIAVVAHALGNAPTLLFEPAGPSPTLWLMAGLLALCAAAALRRRWRRAAAGESRADGIAAA